MSDFKNLNVVYVFVSNFAASKKFYRELLPDWPVAYSSDEIGWEEYGKEGETHFAINLWDPASGEMPTKGAIIVLTVDDAYKTTESLRARGIRCDEVVHIPGVVTYGTLYDPDGNSLQFASSNPG